MLLDFMTEDYIINYIFDFCNKLAVENNIAME
jgi:hypothetical protein